MKYIKHLSQFYDKAIEEKTINPTHISLYMALFQCWIYNNFQNPISISREEIMQLSKISSRATYHKCLNNLTTLGYINYQPSFNPFKSSQIYILEFQ